MLYNDKYDKMIDISTKQYTIILVIGNGFDLNLGLPTRYKDFLSSSYFERLLDNKNELCLYLQKQNELELWVDLEYELQKYSWYNDAKDRTIFYNEYKELCSSLCQYINNIDLSSINEESKAYKIITELAPRPNLLIVNFNYTDSIEYIQKKAQFHLKATHIRVHGNARERSIIFGVEDKADIRPQDVFLRKSANINFVPYDLSKKFKEAIAINIVGHSLGKSDHHYFLDLIRTQSYENATSKNILVTYHGEFGRIAIMKELDELTSNSLFQFQIKNKVTMIDLE